MVKPLFSSYRMITAKFASVRKFRIFTVIHVIRAYTPNGYIVPAEFGVHFLHRMKNVPKRTKMYLEESGLTNTELCKSQIQLGQPPISWKIYSFSAFCNMGVMIPVTAILQGYLFFNVNIRY